MLWNTYYFCKFHLVYYNIYHQNLYSVTTENMTSSTSTEFTCKQKRDSSHNHGHCSKQYVELSPYHFFLHARKQSHHMKSALVHFVELLLVHNLMLTQHSHHRDNKVSTLNVTNTDTRTRAEHITWCMLSHLYSRHTTDYLSDTGPRPCELQVNSDGDDLST